MWTKKIATIVGVVGVTVIALAASVPSGAQQQGKIGVINNDRLLQESAPGQAAAARLEGVVNEWQNRIQALEADLGQLSTTRNQQATTLSAQALADLDRQIEQKNIELQRMRDDAQREFNRIQPQVIAELEQALMPLVEQLAREQGYDFLFNTQTPGLLYYSEALDVTDALIALTAGAAGGGSQ